MDMVMAKIKDVKAETNSHKTFILDAKVDAIPGQFVMVWIPGLDEKPFSLSYVKGDMGVTVLKLGPFTTEMHTLNEGDMLGVRGPFGRGFKISGDKILIVGGGCGVAPLAPLAEIACNRGKDVTAILGARTASEVLFSERIRKAGARVIITTDDGTAGLKGYTVDALKDLLKEEDFDQCCTCGPEVMMARVVEQTHGKIPTQASLERYFKCGIGICGQCVLDEAGLRVCKEGPVFRYKELIDGEFGKYRRDASGAKIPFGVER
ncbi:MAG: dihydroorotate dehydrogenase electron transfer subunit [Candidatus Hydrothermarchaeaceae archaeon]